jgi:hypothetical protein
MVPKTFLITPYHSLSVYLSWYGSYTMHDSGTAQHGCPSDTVSDNNLCAAECPIRHLEHPQAAIAGMWKLLLSMSDDALGALTHGMREPVFLLSSVRDL